MLKIHFQHLLLKYFYLKSLFKDYLFLTLSPQYRLQVTKILVRNSAIRLLIRVIFSCVAQSARLTLF